MKLDIIYRCCNAEINTTNLRADRPYWFNKLKCLETFLNSVNKCQDKINSITFLHDGEKGKLFDSIPKKYDIKEINYKDNESSLVETFKIADSLKNNIYFVEDDFLHLPNSIDIIYHGVNTFKLVTGYDHSDRYTRNDDITLGHECIAFSKKTNCHWRTAESTTCTWATTNQLWKGAVGDFAKTYRLNDRELFRGLTTQHNIRLWTPIPAVTTHATHCYSLGIDWASL
jgi:hypothetical protein